MNFSMQTASCLYAGAVATIILIANIIPSTSIHAQTWQYVYGATSSLEEGYGGVTPVTGNCSSTPNDDGYIAVGTAFDGSGGSDNDVYVIRMDNDGAMMWEKTYDIKNNNSTDEGQSIIELSDGSGFIVVGLTQKALPVLPPATVTATFLMKIDCDGDPVWTQMYSGEYGVIGRNVIEATTGDGALGTSAGDLVVCGYIATTLSDDALLFRTSSTGVLIWDAAYDEGNDFYEEFMDLTEASTVAGQRTGDIIGVGFSENTGQFPDQEGLVIRVNGNTGTIGAAPQGSATYGTGTEGDAFMSVIELQNPNEVGVNGYPNVVVAGFALNNATWGPDIYMVKLRDGDPCRWLVQTTVGDRNPLANASELAYDIQEVTVPITSSGSGGPTGGGDDIAQWDLVVTGEASATSTQRDAFLLGVNSGTLRPIGNLGQVFHPSGTDRSEWGKSLAIVDNVGGRTEGVVMCGTTLSDWLRNGDQGDVYLLKTDVSLSTDNDCEDTFDPGYSNHNLYECITVDYDDFLSEESVTTEDRDRNWGDVVCTNSGNSGKRIPDFKNEPQDASLDISYTVRSTINPLYSGKPLTFLFEGTDIPESVQVQIVNTTGETIWTTSMASPNPDGTLTVQTTQWPAGAYFATIDDGSYRRTIRVVVAE